MPKWMDMVSYSGNTEGALLVDFIRVAVVGVRDGAIVWKECLVEG